MTTIISAFDIVDSRWYLRFKLLFMVYFSIWASKTLQKSSAIQKISVTLSSVIIAIIVCKLLIFSTLKLQQFSLITKFSDTYISSNSRYLGMFYIYCQNGIYEVNEEFRNMINAIIKKSGKLPMY